MKKTLSTQNKIPKSNIEIKIKKQSMKWWKERLNVSFFYLLPYTDKYQLLNVIHYDPPRGDLKDALVTIEYFDIKQDKKLEIVIEFAFENSENQSLLHVMNKDNFEVNKSLFNSLNFTNFSKKDIKSLNKNIKIINVCVHSWNLLEKIIILKLNVNVLKTNTNVLLEYALNVNFNDLIINFLIFDAQNSHFELQENNNSLHFKPINIDAKLKATTQNIFSNADICKINKLIANLEVINAKLMFYDVDIISKKSLGNFSCDIQINNHIFKDVIINATYNATILQKKIFQLLKEFPLIDKIKGFPRTNLKLSDIFENWNKLHIWQVFSKRNINDYLNKYIYINVSDINFVTKIAILEIKFNYPDKQETIIIKQIHFEETPWSQLVKENNGKLIKVKDKNLLMKHARWDLISKHFTILDNNLKVYDARACDKMNISKNKVDYEFKIKFNKNIMFPYKQKISFAYSKKEFLFKTINSLDWNFVYFTKQNIDYFQQKINKLDFDMEWVSLSKKEIDNILINQDYEVCDFVVTHCFFKKINFNKNNKLLIKFTISSPSLGEEKDLKTSIEIDNSKILKKFNELNKADIKLINEQVLLVNPIPLLDVKDFEVVKPFVINYASIQYNEENLSVNCFFQISYLDKSKTIKKMLSFANAYNKNNPKEVEKRINIKKMNNINANNDININYKYQNIKSKTSLKHFFIKWDAWKFKNKKLLIKYKNQIKIFGKYIKYDHHLNPQSYHKWKETNYDK